MAEPLINQLIIGDIHAPMNEISEIYKITRGTVIIGGWSIFHGFNLPTVVFPPLLPESWLSIRSMLSLRNFDLFYAPIPLYDNLGNPIEQPWTNWGEYDAELQFTDVAMQLTNKSIEVPDLDMLPAIRGVVQADIPIIEEYFDELGDEYEGFFHPLQIKTDVYVMAEEESQVVGVGGAHFETPVSVQLGNIHVSTDFRGIGLGRAITTAVSLGILRGERLPTLFVNKNNQIAQNLYESIGFSRFNEFQFYKLERNNK